MSGLKQGMCYTTSTECRKAWNCWAETGYVLHHLQAAVRCKQGGCVWIYTEVSTSMYICITLYLHAGSPDALHWIPLVCPGLPVVFLFMPRPSIVLPPCVRSCVPGVPPVLDAELLVLGMPFVFTRRRNCFGMPFVFLGLDAKNSFRLLRGM